MSVIPMQKMRVLVHKKDVSFVMEEIQKMSSVEFTEVDNGKENTRTQTESNVDIELFSRLHPAIVLLSAYENTPGVFKSLTSDEGKIILSEKEIQEVDLAEEELLTVLDEVENIQDSLNTKENQHRKLSDEVSLLLDWQSASFTLDKLKTARTETLLLAFSGNRNKCQEKSTSFKVKIEKELKDKNIPHELIEVASGLYTLTVLNEHIETAREIAVDPMFLPVELPIGDDNPFMEIKKRKVEIKKIEKEIGENKARLRDMAQTHLRHIRIVHDVLLWQKEREEQIGSAQSTNRVVVLEGWFNATKLPELRSNIESKTKLFDIVEVPTKPDEEPPVEIYNNALVRPFEFITRLYGMPAYKDIDPTMFLAGFFFLFFGLSLTDVGYGIFLIFIALLMVFYLKVSKEVKLFGQLLLFVGSSSVLVGLLFGGYLGIDPNSLPNALQAIQRFDPIGNPLPVFYLALSLGVVQVMFGMVLKIYSDAKNNKLWDGIFDQGPWLLLFLSAISYLLVDLGYVTAVDTDTSIKLMYLTAVLVVLASGRNGKGIFGKIQMSLLSAYQSIGYFSDILSYSRLLALGLATSALAFAVNLIADIVREMIPYVGVVLAVFILIAGHLFNLAVNTLGAFIHSARLQFVEFFGKFITGTGKPFRPFSRKQSYVTVKK